MESKTKREVGNTTTSQAKDNVSDLVTYGLPDMWKLITKASSKEQNFFITTKAMEITSIGVVLQTERYEGGAISQSTVFIPNVIIREYYRGDKVDAREIVCSESKPKRKWYQFWK